MMINSVSILCRLIFILAMIVIVMVGVLFLVVVKGLVFLVVVVVVHDNH